MKSCTEMTVKASELRIGDKRWSETRQGWIYVEWVEVGPFYTRTNSSDIAASIALDNEKNVTITRPDPVPDAAQVLRELREWVQENAATIDCGGTHGPLEDLEYVNAADLLAKLTELEAKS